MKEDLKVASSAAGASVEIIKRVISALRERRYFAALKEVYNLFKTLYNTHLKGKYVTVKGRKIPLTAVVIAAIFALYVLYPSSDQPRELPLAEEAEVQKEMNNYAKDGVKVYDLRKCDNAVCGYLENVEETPIKNISIEITFHDQSGVVVYRGGVEASDVKPMTRNKLTIPSEVPFAYFKLAEVNAER